MSAIPVDTLRQFCRGALRSVGTTEHHAEIATDALVTADTWGIFTHGTKLLGGYVRRLRAGGLQSDTEPEIVDEGDNWAIVDGQSCLGQVVAVFAMNQAIARAQGRGIAFVGVRNSCHFAAAGYYAWLAARKGMIGIAMANDIPTVAAPGSRHAVLGSNPISYAIPVAGQDPILLDIATSTVAGGKVFARNARGEPIPPGWINGPDGQPTTDGSLHPHQASLTPMADHKGYGLALLIEVLSAALSGAAMASRVGSWLFDEPDRATDHGAAFLCIDVASMMPGLDFTRRVEALVREIRDAPTIDGCERLQVPGEREWKHRRRALDQGLLLPADVLESIRKLAAETGVAWTAGCGPE